MAQKKGAVAKKANGVAKTPTKRQAKQETEEEVAAAVQSPTKKGKKQPVKPVEPLISSDDEADGIQMYAGSESETEKAPIDSEAEEDSNAEEESDEDEAEPDQALAEETSDEEEEEDEEADSEEEPGQVSLSKSQIEATAENDDSDDDDDEAPTEAPIAKKTTEKEGGIPKVKVGRIPTDIPNDRVVFVNQLPQQYKHLDLLGVFTKFGPINTVERIKTKAGGTSVVIAFETAEAAAAAVAAKGKAVTLNDTVVKVSLRLDKEDLNKRTVVVAQIGKATTKEHLQGHFQKCGKIEAVTLSNNRLNPVGFVRFESADSVAKALELTYTQLNGNHISVRSVDFKSPKAANYTVAVRNEANLGSYKPDELEKVLKKCGEIADLEVVCTRTVLAFVTFKTTEAAEKALQLSGKKAGNLTLQLDPFESNTAARSIVVTNINTGVTEEEVKELFSQSGAISKVTWLNHRAIIKFETDDGFCKSFLLNETELKGQPIFLEPNSHIKLKWLNKRQTNKPSGPPFQGKFPGGGGGGAGKFGKKFGGPGGQHGHGAGNFKNKNFNKGGPNKRPAQDSGSTPPHFYKRAKTN